ncbi:hypothetical protein NPIL_351641, partial [Nephila pilipes]
IFNSNVSGALACQDAQAMWWIPRRSSETPGGAQQEDRSVKEEYPQ